MTNPTTTRYGFEAYLPLPKEERKGVALCLSGGGYRAALFHLGAMRRLNELGILAKVDTFTSVSGGSIVAAQLASRLARSDGWPESGPAWEEGVAGPMRAFAGRNIRTKAILSRFRPLNWLRRNVSSEALAAEYAAGPAPGLLADLRDHPRFVLCATDLNFRTQWVFDSGKRRVGDEETGFGGVQDWTLARAVAASSCLPIAFPAMRVGEVELSDGGVYDNLGLEPVWRDHAVVLVSTGAPSFPPKPRLGPLWASLRYSVTLLEQATDVRKRWLIAGFIAGELDGAYWGIDSKPTNYEYDDPAAPGYSDSVITDVISQIRIDLDVFSDAEIAVLENHGYLMAEIAVQRHARELVAEDAALAVPHPDWLDEAKVRNALRDSHKTKLFARGH
jgi:NTE family protein